MDREVARPVGDEKRPDVTRWMVGCAVGGAATIGIVILVFLVALALQPPAWVQVLLGGLLAIGAAIFTWLVASAWQPGESREASRREPEAKS